MFKKPHEYSRMVTVHRCPECGEPMVSMGYKFRAPKSADSHQWERIESAIREGREWELPTVRKQKPKLTLDPKLRIGLGIYGKRRTKKPAS